MPELPEVEAYRRLAEDRALCRTIAEVDAPDAWYLKGGIDAPAVEAALVGRRFTAARRIGKLLLLDADGGAGPVVGLRFGMTGRLLVDGNDAVGELLYTSKADRPEWDRSPCASTTGVCCGCRIPAGSAASCSTQRRRRSARTPRR